MSAKKQLQIEEYNGLSDHEKEDLIKSYIPLVKRVVHRISGRLPDNVDLKEMLNSGLIGLVDALEKFDPGKDTNFTTYAQFRIRGAILDSFRTQDWLPRSIRYKANKIEKAYQQVEQELGRPATDQEVASHMELDLRQFRKQLNQVSNAVIYSFEELGYGKGESQYHTDPNSEKNNPLTTTIRKERIEILARALDRLSHKERLVITLHYYEELSLREIGCVLELTESRISQIRTRALIRLKNYLKSL